MKWTELSNGELLATAAQEFDAIVTVDRNLQFQQHRGGLPISVITMAAVTNRLDDLAPFAPDLLRLLASGLQR
jgi:hypothetical protein